MPRDLIISSACFVIGHRQGLLYGMFVQKLVTECVVHVGGDEMRQGLPRLPVT